MDSNTPPHRPPHIYLDNTWYIITASTLSRARYLITDAHLLKWVSGLKMLVKEYNFKLSAWVVLHNHYHLLIKPSAGHDVGKFIGHLNGRSSRELNLMDHTKGRKIWYSYWDTCIRTEKDYWTRFNYIHNNPVKHGYVQNHVDWKYSSYGYYLRTKGEAWLADCWQRYPVIDYSDDRF